MIHHRIIAGSLFVLLIFSVWGRSSSLLYAQPEEIKRFLHEAPLQWEEYTRHPKKLQGRISEQSTFKQFISGNLKLDVKFEGFLEVKMNDECKLISILSKRTTGGKIDYEDPEIFAWNTSYAFALRRKSSTSPWVLTELNDVAKRDIPSDFGRSFKTFEFQTNVLVTLNDKYLTAIVQDPGFQVLGCRRVGKAGEELVEVEFDYTHQVKDQANPNMKGTMLLDPQRFWIVRSYEINVRQQTIKYQVLEMGQTEGSLPVPKCAVRRTDLVSPKDALINEAESRYEYNLSEPRRLPGDEEFTLSAFGLPDPVGFETKQPRRWYLWLLLAAIGCLVLGVGARALKRRVTASP